MFKKYLPPNVICSLSIVSYGVLLLLISGCTGTVMKVPKPMPNIVSAYKSITLYGDRPGMQNSGIHVKPGDYLTIMAKGEVDVYPGNKGFVFTPAQRLFYRIGKKGHASPYPRSFPALIAAEEGSIYLGVVDGPRDAYGEPLRPEYYRDNKGAFVVDILVWQKDDVILITDFFERASRDDPQNKEIRAFVDRFRNLKTLKEALIAMERTKAEEPKEMAKDTVVLKEREIIKDKQVQAQRPKDTSPPTVTLMSPETGKEMTVPSKTSRITVVGKAVDESGVAEVTVNGEPAELDENGNFSADVLLRVGENEIQVAAIDVYRNLATTSFKIVREGRKMPAAKPRPLLDTKGKYHALVIGINQYKHIQQLEIAKRDAIEVDRLLREGYGFETKLLLDATRMAVLNAINDFRKQLGEEDHLLIYYAGHGDYDKVADKAYWLPADAERDNPTNWIMSDDITTNIKRMASKHVLIISDSCYSGTFVRSVVTDLSTRGTDREGFIRRMLEKTSRTLMSSGGNEPVADSGGSGHSVFAEAFLKGLREIEEIAFTADELFYRIREKVIGKADQTPQYSNIRNSGHEGGDFVFVRK